MQITQEQAAKVLSNVDAGLINGAGRTSTPGAMCVEQAVATAMGESLAWLAACPKRERRRWVTVAIARGAIRGAPLPPAGCSVELTHSVT